MVGIKEMRIVLNLDNKSIQLNCYVNPIKRVISYKLLGMPTDKFFNRTDHINKKVATFFAISYQEIVF